MNYDAHVKSWLKSINHDAHVQDYRECLVARYMPLVRRIVHKNISKQRDVFVDSTNDMMQEGMVALIWAVDHFDASKGVKFITYAYHCIRRRIQTQSIESRLVRVSSSAFYRACREDGTHFNRQVMAAQRCIGGQSHMPERWYHTSEEDHGYLLEVVNELPSPYKECVEHRYGFNGKPTMTLRQYADKDGTSYNMVRRRLEKAYTYMRERLGVC